MRRRTCKGESPVQTENKQAGAPVRRQQRRVALLQLLLRGVQLLRADAGAQAGQQRAQHHRARLGQTAAAAKVEVLQQGGVHLRGGGAVLGALATCI